jgi:hypothetical protein
MEQTDKVKGVVDIVFLVDKTGSMQPCLDALQANIGMFVNYLANGSANAPSPVKDWRIMVAGYGDFDADGQNWWASSPFSADVPTIQKNLSELKAAGGGDEPESLLDGLYRIAVMGNTEKGAEVDPGKWRYRSAAARVVVFFTDATFKARMSIPEAVGGTLGDVTTTIQAQRIILCGFCPDAPCYAEMGEIDKSELEFIGPLNGATKAMATFTSDQNNFKRTLEALAKSVSKSVETIEAL